MDHATEPPAPRQDWRWQMRHRITSLDAVADQVPGLVISDGMRRVIDRYPFAVTPYFLSLVAEPSANDPILRQCLPDPAELDDAGLEPDELGEFSTHSPVRGLIHRYPDRVVCVLTATCPTYCRHCTRKRLVGRPQFGLTPAELDRQIDYVRSHPGIKDVIISGGEPLVLSTEHLEDVVAGFRSVPSVEIIRIGTRSPATLPMRVDEALCEMLERYHPVWVNTHFNHPRELTPMAAEACDRLLRHGIPVNSQTVLLRGVNDSPQVLEALCRALLRIRVRPYYLFQCDPVAGVAHFRTPVRRGLDLIRHLDRTIGGLGVPRFALDAVHGGGKVSIRPDYLVDCSRGRVVFRTVDGETVSYPDRPADCSTES